MLAEKYSKTAAQAFRSDYLRDIKEGSRAGAGPVEVPEPLPMPLVETPGPLPKAIVETPAPPELDGGVGGCSASCCWCTQDHIWI